MRNRVLDNDRLYTLRMSHSEAHPDWPAIVLLVQNVACQPELLREVVYDLSEVVEGIVELRCGRSVTFAEARIVRRNEMIAVGQE